MEMDMSDIGTGKLGRRVVMQGGYDQIVARTVEALKAEGFGVLTEIDVQATLKTKLAVDVPRYRILGACNPALAHRALSAAPEVGLLLPCNVTVRELEDGNVEVALVDPLTMLSVVERPELNEVAREAGQRLERVAQALKA
jgi:uncharacterized protein (DUF302 family)